ncbi:MAG: NB-ARC domain-containing protein [Ardenticatenaceae bacterium]|nr:NB-ARC domain-containing protein [Ardenticatenaceae bacterium]
MNDAVPIELPDDLKARLEAAGVTDEVSLTAAFEADPALKEDFEASLVASAMQAFIAAGNSAELVALIERAPFVLEDDFVAAVEQAIEEAEQAAETQVAAGLRERLADLRRIKAQREEAQQPPVVQALLAFLRAEDDEAARAVFEERRALLLPYEAQRQLDEVFRGDAPESRRHVEARRALLRELRRAGQVSPPLVAVPAGEAGAGRATFDNRGLQAGYVEQTAGDKYVKSAHAETGGTAVVINNINQVPLEPRWVRPGPPKPEMDLVERRREVNAVERLLRKRGKAAITSNALAVQGMAGVGKTILANLLALRWDERYPGGVLWELIGSEIQSPDQANLILNRWASYGFGGQQKEGYQFTPEVVRAILSGHGPLLVVLDDVWHLDALKPLVAALPPEAHLLVTTRNERVAADLRGGVYNLDVLSEGDALKLIRLRLAGRRLTRDDRRWMVELSKSVECHALALDIAVGSLRRRGPDEWAAAAQRIATDIRQGTGFGELPLTESERTRVVEKSLKLSYDALEDQEQRRFRLLGAIAPEAEFTTEAAAALWACGEEEARNRLNHFAGLALLTRIEERGQPSRWRQHSLLRTYALALLRVAGEHEAAAARHAALYNEAMRRADDEQRSYQMLPAMPQLRHAFGWAIEQDLERALNLIANCADLQAGFGMVREGFDWSRRAVVAARQRSDQADVAHALGSLGNALSRMAGLPGEDRRARLFEALEAYDEALRFRRPEVAPLDYATTQNNRANILSELAGLPGEDRRARLFEALAAYDEALRFRRPEVAPLAYATTQNNRGPLLRELAGLPGEDRRARLFEALAAAWEAFSLFGEFQHAHYQQISQRTVWNVKNACGEDFDALWQTLGVGPCPTWLSEGNGESDEAERELLRPLLAFINANSLEEMRRLLAGHPLLLTDAVAPIFADLFREYEGNEEALALLGSRQALLEACREQGVEAVFAALTQAAEFEQALNHYLELRQAAEADQQNVAAWQRAAEAGEALLAPGFADAPGVDHDALRADVASSYNSLGSALDDAGDKPASLIAFERAISLQPDFAMWRRNRAGTLIELGRLDEAEIARARELEPEAPRLAQLEAELAQARGAA